MKSFVKGELHCTIRRLHREHHHNFILLQIKSLITTALSALCYIRKQARAHKCNGEFGIKCSKHNDVPVDHSSSFCTQKDEKTDAIRRDHYIIHYIISYGWVLQLVVLYRGGFEF